MMTAAMNRQAFFAAVRASGVCGPTISQVEVDGLNGILDAWAKYGPANPDLRHVAYTMATAWHEARLNSGIREIGRGAGKAYGKPTGPYGQVYYGRGPSQITWYDNYVKFGKLLNLDLAQRPDLALEPETGAAILVVGSLRGMFRAGKTLSRYFSTTADDPVGARDIINGDMNMIVKAQTDRNLTYGRMIAGHHTKFLGALKAASAPVAAKPAPAAPAVAPAAPQPATGLLARLKAILVG